jgi:cytochrome c biogenesis protein CcmG, thiol:disulfide interchange protein DsbE
MKKRFFQALPLLFLIGTSCTFSSFLDVFRPLPTKIPSLQPGDPAPSFVIETFDGENFDLSVQRGKVVVINFWASWSGPCRTEAKVLKTIWNEYKDRGVAFIGIAYTDTERNARHHLEEFGVEYPTAPDKRAEISKMYLLRGVPETYIVDQKGNLVMTIPGPTNVKDLRAILDKLLTTQG